MGEVDLWAQLRLHTPARIGLASAGHALPTREMLQLRQAESRARDSVRSPFSAAALQMECESELGVECAVLESRAPDTDTYIRRPDLGRRLSQRSAALLKPAAPAVVFVIAAGLSPAAVQSQAVAVVKAVVAQSGVPFTVAVVERGRVAIGDEIGQLLQARAAAVLIGERPGLSSFASMGVYVTPRPRLECTDAERTCISNIHGAGLSVPDAARQLRERLRPHLTSAIAE
jgi:ethanolamine ammonia-lyase small subunit